MNAQLKNINFKKNLVGFLRKLRYTINNPGKVLNYLHLKLNQLDPTSVSDIDAKRFFEKAEKGNKKLFKAIAPRIKMAKTIFDVGANSGYFTKGLIEKGFKGRVCLFEPVPNLISIAVRTLAEFKNDKIFVNSALGESNCILDIFLPEDSNIGWITFVKSKATSTKSIKVTVKSTLEYASLYRPEFIKIDVEGFELFVMRPFLSLISSTYKPTFLVELGWGRTNPHWPEFLNVASQLKANGYNFINLSDRQNPIMTIDQLRALDKTIDVLIEV